MHLSSGILFKRQPSGTAASFGVRQSCDGLGIALHGVTQMGMVGAPELTRQEPQLMVAGLGAPWPD
jgi:hypothetical protein